MRLLKGFGLWTLLGLLPHCWTMPQSAESIAVVSNKGVVTSKLPYIVISAMAETLRSDMTKMRSSLERMADSLEKLETLLPRRHEGLGDTLEHTVGNALRNMTNNNPSTKILSEKLEWINRAQERNWLLINTQMEWLRSLDETLKSFTNFHRGTSVSDEDTDTSSLTLYQQQVVERLTSIDKKLDRVTIEKKSGGSTAKVDGDNGSGRKDTSSGRSLGEKKIDEGYNESSTDDGDAIKIEVPRCEALKDTGLRSGVYALNKGDEFVWGNTSAVLCDTTTNGGGWTVIQKRGPGREEAINFTRSWSDYANGFGNLFGEFWLGNEIVHRMTFYYGPHELRIELEDWEGGRVWAQYSNFDCFESNLNGDYYEMKQYRRTFRGIIWEHWRGNYSLKNTVMMIRSRKSYMKGKIQRDFRNPVTPFLAF